MKRLALALATAALSLGATSAGAMTMPMPDMDPGSMVSIVYQAYNPSQIATLTGSTITWHNESPRAHTVVSDDGSFRSGDIFSSLTYEHRFDAAGAFTYYCTIHPGMRGEVDVYDLLLDAPKQAIAPAQALTLGGRTALPAGEPIAIEADEGTGFHRVATTAAGGDGNFTAALHPQESGSYRAVAGDASSPPVAVRVVNRSVKASAARHGHRVVVSTRVAPGAAGGTVVLQVASREHFGWWPTRRARLGSRSAARFTLNTRRRLRMRVVLTLRDGATVLAGSRDVRVAGGR